MNIGSLYAVFTVGVYEIWNVATAHVCDDNIHIVNSLARSHSPFPPPCTRLLCRARTTIPVLPRRPGAYFSVRMIHSLRQLIQGGVEVAPGARSTYTRPYHFRLPRAQQHRQQLLVLRSRAAYHRHLRFIRTCFVATLSSPQGPAPRLG